MGNGFVAYLQQLEFFLFFSGYPLVCMVVLSVGARRKTTSVFFQTLIRSLPLSYGLAGTLYLGLLAKNLYPEYTITNLSLKVQYPFLCAWGLLSLLFWIPVFRKKEIYSFIHSLVFFILFVKEIILSTAAKSDDRSMVHNMMNIYTISILLYIALVIIVTFLWLLLRKKSA